VRKPEITMEDINAMSKEIQLTPEQEAKREAWLKNLADFTVIAKGYEDKAKQTYDFLKKALKQVTPEMPFRGPKEYVDGNKKYEFALLEGDITDCSWREKITEDGQLTFTQKGLAGIVIQRDSTRQPIKPWDL